MKNRTKDQCYQRYMYSIREDLRRGGFTDEEDFIIMAGVKIFKDGYSKIVDCLPHRTAVQLCSRYNTFLRANFDSWTLKAS